MLYYVDTKFLRIWIRRKSSIDAVWNRISDNSSVVSSIIFSVGCRIRYTRMLCSISLSASFRALRLSEMTNGGCGICEVGLIVCSLLPLPLPVPDIIGQVFSQQSGSLPSYSLLKSVNVEGVWSLPNYDVNSPCCRCHNAIPHCPCFAYARTFARLHLHLALPLLTMPIVSRNVLASPVCVTPDCRVSPVCRSQFSRTSTQSPNSTKGWTRPL